MTDTEVDRRVGIDTDAALRLEGVRKTYRVGDELFFGQDRLYFVGEALARG